jgi:hypothetical protein
MAGDKIVIPSCEDMDRGLRSLVSISITLGKINKNIEKFLDREDARINVETRRAGWSPSDLLDQAFATFCCWCMADLGPDDKKYACDHAVLCAACAPCDACQEG